MAIPFALAMFVGSGLLFLLQPLIAKALLPDLGGTPAVWNTCMVFFQATLLSGYGYAHLTTRWLRPRRQAIAHAVLILIPFAVLPIVVGETDPSVRHPAAWLLGRLATTVGLPFFAVATTAPILQRWYAATRRRGADDPYFLYGASNLGSVLALVGFPILIEPNLSLDEQGRSWMVGYGLLAALIFGCAWTIRGADRSGIEVDAGVRDEPIRPGRWWTWAGLAFVPSSLMLGVTTYLTTDIAAIPLLWVIPLAIYLLTFALTFARRPIPPAAWMIRLLPIAVVLLLPGLAAGLVQPFWIPIHLLAFFAAAMVCHGALAADRPPAHHLTSFYLALSLGGVLGGAFNALVAPLVFDRIAEYPLAIVLACVALARGERVDRPGRELGPPIVIGLIAAGLVTNMLGSAESIAGAFGLVIASGMGMYVLWTHRTHRLRFAAMIGAVLFATGLSTGVDGRVLARGRGFFGAWRVTEARSAGLRRFFQGSTLHGQQALDPDRRGEPLAYFRRGGPIGQVFEVDRSREGGAGVAIVGLGAGTLACYAEPGERWSFFEIDPDVVRVASDPDLFTFLRDCRAARLDLIVGDARLRLREVPDHAFDRIVLDAFSSDAVPVHLLTREAIRLYRSKLAAGGLLAFNLSNRYLDLEPVLGAQALDAGMACRIRYDLDLDPAERLRGELPSIWVVLADRSEDLGPIASDPRWTAPRVAGRVWTDDFSDVASHLILGHRPGPQRRERARIRHQ